MTACACGQVGEGGVSIEWDVLTTRNTAALGRTKGTTSPKHKMTGPFGLSVAPLSPTRNVQIYSAAPRPR